MSNSIQERDWKAQWRGPWDFGFRGFFGAWKISHAVSPSE